MGYLCSQTFNSERMRQTSQHIQSGASYFHYYIRDHQGNNRVVAKYDGTIEQTTHYYPYGGILSQSTNQGVQKYKYNGKEFDRMHGLNMYDYGARQQDPAVGMFTSMDPLCEKYYNISPYIYCAGNPVRYVDVDGKFIANIVGGLVGGAVEIGIQMLVEKKSFSDSIVTMPMMDYMSEEEIDTVIRVVNSYEG